MCKQHDIYFQNCLHKIACRLSTCRFQKCGTTRSGKRWRACMSYAYMVRTIPGDCSSCYLKHIKTDIDLEFKIRRLSMIGEYEENGLAELEAWQIMRIEDAHKCIPYRQGIQPDRSTPRKVDWNSRKHTKRTTSILCNEFKPEDVIGHDSWETRLITDDDTIVQTPETTWIGDWDDSDDDGILTTDTSDSASDSGNDTEDTELDDDDLCAMLDAVHDSIFGDECQALT